MRAFPLLRSALLRALTVYAWIAIICSLLLALGAFSVGGWYYYQNSEEINEGISEGIEAAKDQVTKWVKSEEEQGKSFTDKVTNWFKQD